MFKRNSWCSSVYTGSMGIRLFLKVTPKMETSSAINNNKRALESMPWEMISNLQQDDRLNELSDSGSLLSVNLLVGMYAKTLIQNQELP